MTAQFMENLVYEGVAMAMCTAPLSDFFALGGRAVRLKPRTNTALWRGYIGSWEVLDGRLYLVGISATMECGGKATLEHFFPGYPKRVFAHWFSAELRVPTGELRKYVHMGWASEYEDEMIVSLQRGVVTGVRMRSGQPVWLKSEPDARVDRS
ncbi:hypothetical protein [Pseudoduganella sp.]|uniref:hypothetical protein n=1 Tax=Pseudoduganella sp. TaxID=1880898 RepID=UPI0035AE6371